MKPGHFTQMYIHLIFAVKYRDRVLNDNIRPEIFSYIAGIIKSGNNKSIITNGVSDHVHILVGFTPTQKISDLVANIKMSSSRFINDKKWLYGNFQWQDGYGAFTYGKSQLNTIYNYIANQELHHRKRTFKEEYIGFLKKFGIEYNEKYLFDFFE
jgi:REP element-mobilizing transposase RayT